MSLTRRQSQILNFLKTYLQEKGFSPSFEEIATYLQVSSLNGVYKHLQALEQRGYIRRLSNRARSIQLCNPDQIGKATIPLLGTIAAGTPIEALTEDEEVSVPEDFLGKGRHFALRVRGDSMIDEQIRDGDLVIISERTQAHNGQTVVALIDGETATLKKYYREKNMVRLQPANPVMDPIYVREDVLRIQGIVTGVIRRY
jgi:repressor LexA